MHVSAHLKKTDISEISTKSKPRDMGKHRVCRLIESGQQ